MNTRRLLAGGLVAGLILNVGESLLHGFVLADVAAAAMRALGGDVTGSVTGLGLLVLVTFAQGVVGVGLYANSKFPAYVVGLILWLLSGVYSATYFYAGFPGLMPNGLLWWPVPWEAIQYPLALIVGAKVYGDRHFVPVA